MGGDFAEDIEAVDCGFVFGREDGVCVCECRQMPRLEGFDPGRLVVGLPYLFKAPRHQSLVPER